MSKRIDIFWHEGLTFCPVCQSPLAGEEIDFEECDSCGGEENAADEDDTVDDLDHHRLFTSSGSAG